MLKEKGGKNKNFASKFGFIMAAAGSAIGLGNIWNFSYKLGHYGGGAFLLTYLVMVLLMGIIIMIAEMFIGQRAQGNVVTAYSNINKRWAFVGGLLLWQRLLSRHTILLLVDGRFSPPQTHLTRTR